MPLLKLATAFKRLFAPRRKPLGRSPLLASFLERATAIQPAIRDYLAHLLELGLARSHDRGTWYITGSGPVPVAFDGLSQFPVLFATTDNHNAVLIVIDLYGGLSLYSRSPITDLAEVRLHTVLTPDSTASARDLFFWGICPYEPGFAQSLHERTCAILESLGMQADLNGLEADRECFQGTREDVVGLRVLESNDEARPSVAIPQFFAPPHADSANVLMVDGVHSDLDAVTTLAGLRERLRAFTEVPPGT